MTATTAILVAALPFPSYRNDTVDPKPSASTEETGQPSQFTIVSSGDILLHLSVNEFARVGQTYDYTTLFEPISPWIEQADLALCSLEVPIVPPGEEPSNYPALGSPPEIADSLKAMGWDGCALATNHTMDRGFDGVESTIDNFERVGLGHHGTARTEDESRAIQYYTVESGGQQVVVAHLSASTLTNGMAHPSGKQWSWNVVGPQGHREVDDLIADAKRARDGGADLVVVSMHWGTEYVTEPTEEQTEIGQQLDESGVVDLVFGNHSHVAEPVTKLDGGPGGDGMWVVWSMGNTISGQTVDGQGYGVLTGLVTTATVDVSPSGDARVSNLEWTAITQDVGTYRLFELSKLMDGQVPRGTSLTPAAIQGRADAIYPTMTADGSSERTSPPSSGGRLVEQERR
ncbi:MAG: CapA family protein [Actinomycetaceae bacterium]|nr:CapA family protein [Actinomycetaceae bacterium]